MKIDPFSRATVVSTIEFIGETPSQAKFDQVVIRLEREKRSGQGPAASAQYGSTGRSVAPGSMPNCISSVVAWPR